MHPVDSISVVGLGKIGGSLATALVRSGMRVTGYDENPSVCRAAVERGVVSICSHSLDHAVTGASTVCLATPVRTIIRQVASVAPHMQPGGLLFDTGSSKAAIVEAMSAVSGSIHSFGAHPIAGNEFSGTAAWDPDLFRNRSFVVSPTGTSDDASLAHLRSLLEMTGCRVVEIDARTHDMVIAQTSHLPLLLGTALLRSTTGQTDFAIANASAPESTDDTEVFRSLVGGQFRAVTRMAHLNSAMLADLMETNAAALEQACMGIIHELRKLSGAARSGTLRPLLEEARVRKERLQC